MIKDKPTIPQVRAITLSLVNISQNMPAAIAIQIITSSAVIIFLLLITKNIENAHYREEYLPNVFFHQSGIPV